MSNWSSQRYKYEGIKGGVSADIIDVATKVSLRIHEKNPRLCAVLTLRHLSILSGTSYPFIRRIVRRKESDQYKSFFLKKRIPGRSKYREINIPRPDLRQLQQWIVVNILRHTEADSASFAYHPNSHPKFAALTHCSCKWLLKVDITDFFHNITESMVYEAFKELGYNKLLCFELARITTIRATKSQTIQNTRFEKWGKIPKYMCAEEGFLPQGAPTSPMLSNLVMKKLDQELGLLAKKNGYRYTRYADDLAFSTIQNLNQLDVVNFKNKVSDILLRNKFKPNKRKTAISGPGSRRIVLGLLVDSKEPRLTKGYKNMLRQHMYYLCSPEHGPANHAKARKLSISTLYHHVRGKISWAETVEPEYGSSLLREFQQIEWPLLDLSNSNDNA